MVAEVPAREPFMLTASRESGPPRSAVPAAGLLQASPGGTSQPPYTDTAREERLTSVPRPVLLPSSDHPITVEPAGSRVTVAVGDHQIAASSRGLTLREASYPPAYYVPIAYVDQALLRRSDTTTYCPYKGDASYYSLELPGGQVVPDAVWTYESPYPAVSEIAGHVAFYGDRTEVTVS